MTNKDTASQSQAVPSELVSPTDERITEIVHSAYLAEEIRWAGFKKDKNDKYTVPVLSPMEFDMVRAVVKYLFSHSAATGKVPDDESIEEERRESWKNGYSTGFEAAKSLFSASASPAAPLAAAVPAEEASEVEYELHQNDGWVAGTVGKNAYSEIMHYAAQYSQDGPVEVFKVVRTKLTSTEEVAPAEPAPIQSSADRIEQLESVVRCSVDDLERIHLALGLPADDPIDAEVMIEHIARLSKPTAQGAASRPNADCSGEPSNCPDNEGYGCACSSQVIDKQVTVWRKEVARLQDLIDTATGPSPSQVTGEPASIDTPAYTARLESYLETGDDEALIRYINRHIAAQATAGREAVLEEAAKEAEKCFVSIGQPDDPHPDAVTFNGAVYDCARSIRALKSYAAEQASGGAK